LVRPIGEVAINKNFAGAPIYKGKEFPNMPDVPWSQMYFKNVSPMARIPTDALHSLGGGDKVSPGKFPLVTEWNPELIEHGVSSYLGGPTRFVGDVVGTATVVAKGENAYDDEYLRKIPLLNRLWLKAGGQYNTQQTFYERYNELKTINDRSNTYRKTKPEYAEKYIQENRKEIELFNMATSMREGVSSINDGINALKAQEQTKEVKEQIEALYDQKDAIMKQFNRQYNIKMKQEN
jgi:hypothetical protein